MNRTEMLLTIAGEEGAEVTQRASKALRFGVDEVQSGQPLTNAERLVEEFYDLCAVMQMLHNDGVVDIGDKDAFAAHVVRKIDRVESYLKYSAQQGTLVDSRYSPFTNGGQPKAPKCSCSQLPYVGYAACSRCEPKGPSLADMGKSHAEQMRDATAAAARAIGVDLSKQVVVERGAPGLALDSGEFVPAAELNRPTWQAPPHLIRMREERLELTEKLSRLRAFIRSEAFKTIDEDDRTDLYEQEGLMGALAWKLSTRIAKAEAKLVKEKFAEVN